MKDVIPAEARAIVYSIFATLGVIIGAVQVGFAAASAGQPVWLTVTLAVYAFIGGAIGITAQANTPKHKAPYGDGEGLFK